jgi:hypothetical protein
MAETPLPSSMAIYGCVMRRAMVKGDLQEMKRLAQEAEEHLEKHGDVRTILEVLKTEIAKLESKG